jgi:hypothetical protein
MRTALAIITLGFVALSASPVAAERPPGTEHTCPEGYEIVEQSIDPGSGPPELGDGQVLLIKVAAQHYVGSYDGDQDVSHYDICGPVKPEPTTTTEKPATTTTTEQETTTTTTTTEETTTTTGPKVLDTVVTTSTTTFVFPCFTPEGDGYVYDGDPAHGPCGTLLTTTTAPTGPTLPVTGAESGGLAGIGVVLLGLGTALVALVSRRGSTW